MPFSSTPSSFLGNIMPESNLLTNQGNPLQNMFNTASAARPNLLASIQSARNNELERQTKQAQLSKYLVDLQSAPLDNEVKRVAVLEALGKLDPNSLPNQLIKSQMTENLNKSNPKSPENFLNELKAMNTAGYAPSNNTMPNREELLSVDPQTRRNILGARTQYGESGAIAGPVTGQRYAPNLYNGKMVATGAVDSNGEPIYESAKQATFNRTSANQQKKTAFDLRKEFQGIQQVKDYQTIKNQVSAMDALMKNLSDKNNRLALDQGLITLFNKITDPQSVVRESEYERTPANLALANRFNGALEKLAKGGAGLTNEDRQALVFGAKVIADARGSEYNQLVDNYEGLATEFGVKPSNVTSGFGRHKAFNSADSKSSGFEIVGVRNE